MPKLLAMFIGFAFCASLAAQDREIESAKQLFQQYVALEQAYNPDIADLYAEEASIKSRRTFPMGDPIETTIPGTSYRTLLRQRLPAAQQRGERNSYSKVSYAPEGKLIRIKASRLSELSKRRSPITFLVGPSPNGQWLIYEETSELQQ